MEAENEEIVNIREDQKKESAKLRKWLADEREKDAEELDEAASFYETEEEEHGSSEFDDDYDDEGDADKFLEMRENGDGPGSAALWNKLLQRGDDSSGRLHDQSRDRKTAKRERLKKAWEKGDLNGIKHKRSNTHASDPKSITAEQRVAQYEERGITCFEVFESFLPNGKPGHGILNCKVCNKTVALKKFTIENHLEAKSHKMACTFGPNNAENHCA